MLLTLLYRKPGKPDEPGSKSDVKFTIAEDDETDKLMPEIVVDPPGNNPSTGGNPGPGTGTGSGKTTPGSTDA